MRYPVHMGKWQASKASLSLTVIGQAGATGIVTPLHEVPTEKVQVMESIPDPEEMLEWKTAPVLQLPINGYAVISSFFLPFLCNRLLTIRNINPAKENSSPTAFEESRGKYASPHPLQRLPETEALQEVYREVKQVINI